MARDVESYVHRIGRTGRAGDLFISLTHSLTHSLSLPLSLSLCPCPCLFLTLSFTLTHSLTLSLSHLPASAVARGPAVEPAVPPDLSLERERVWERVRIDREGEGKMEKLERVCVIGGWGVLYFPCTSMNVCV